MPKIQPGQVLNPKGRPKGSTQKIPNAVKLQASVNARAIDLLEGMLSKAVTVIDERLDDGDAVVAMWLMDRMVKSGNAMLPSAIKIRLTTIDDVIEAAQLVTEMVMLRKLSIDDGLRSLDMLSKYCAFRAFERIDELQKLVDDMKHASDAKTINGGAATPTWGRLSEDSETANKRPAE